jgi:CBS domain-containing protein
MFRYSVDEGGMQPAARSIAALTGPDDSTRHPARLIALHHHNRFPVVGDGKPLGAMTRVDVFDAYAR